MTDYVIGVDVHKRNHTFVAVDCTGRKLATKTVMATTAGHEVALRWARITCPQHRLWGIEDVRGVSARLEAELMDAGEAVVRVPPKLTARQRASARTVGKSDPIDALAVARAVLREPDLPRAQHDAHSRDVKLLVDYRDRLVRSRRALANRVLARLHELEPEYSPIRSAFCFAKHRQVAQALLASHTGVLAELTRAELEQIAVLSGHIASTDKRIKDIVVDVASALLTIDGCGPLTTAKIIGETAGITRFANEAKYARYVGVAPIPHWSGGAAVPLRLTRSGNRQLNRALYTIAMLQIRRGGRGEQYYRQRIAGGDTHRHALRCLKRHICRAVYHALIVDTKTRAAAAAQNG
ncbi:IS110 family transposase [Mycobacterium marseillense]|uniref:IS110 family transposase n=1 Tax=Mycobacterium marseillense TaxID=701042 RepID=A0AAC9YPW8_9MYCO|nr:IS110 family transposase [Mycobacterium marseillense]ASW93267.1 IS110 family transposase [Mycobacterium marseillense]